MTEKPMATRWQDGVRMVKACADAGVQLFVVKQNRRNSTMQLLKRAVTEKCFGKNHMVHINVFWTRPQDYYYQAEWRGTWKFDEPKDYDEQIKEANYQTTSVYGFGHPLYYKNVIEVLKGKTEPETDGREGLKSLELLIAAYLSARDGKTISLRLEY